MELRIGIIGCGDIFDHHRRAWDTVAGASVTAVFDRDTEVAAAAASEAGARVCDSLDDLYNSCNVVDLCTPPESHTAIALDALDAGCHVLIEKPVVLRTSDWEEIHSSAETRGLKVSGLHNQKYFGVNARALEWLSEGKIGRLLRIQDLYMVTPENEWMLGEEGHWSHSMAGGRWGETLPHNLYLLYMFAGPMDLADVTVIRSDSAPEGALAEELVITLNSRSCVATIHFSANCNLDRRSMTLIGSDGVIEIVPAGRALTSTTMRSNIIRKALGLPYLEACGKLAQALPDRIRFLTGMASRVDAHGRAIQAFADHVRGDGPCPTGYEEVEYSVRLFESITTEIERQLTMEGAETVVTLAR